ncbi:3-oxoacyl-[acyl-carrier-protein] synthase 2 [Symmachiella dynata]|uniref:3-oxoacyl-[acyl-carrier-protein] synthase 2 n=1 Tax=Symmachiella dynata TaxID=2527995 RepID=A0A517ZNX2_9PLAN|nr:beta-ketoacyl-[acyl-carrier-protein] synthase family protein [Symmachiella dynata]QDU44177.1 3-oxoacyl-[acyl-carrier-protein] synthase 2 [Symmachiella dynata]
MSDGHESRTNVVITGAGVVSPIGIGLEAFTDSLLNGKSGISEFQLFEEGILPSHIGGEVSDFNNETVRNFLPKKGRRSLKVMCREIQLGVVASHQAIENAGVSNGEIASERFGVEFGANLMFSPPTVLKDACLSCWDLDENNFHFEEWGTTGLSKMEPLWLLQYLPNMPACHIGIFYDLRGPSNSQTMDEASGNIVLGEAVRIIERGAADAMVAAATGTRLHPVKTVHAVMWDTVAKADNPAEACRPFEKNRSGQVIAEGACSLILESEEHANARGANILGRILGTGTACVTSPNLIGDTKKSLVIAMQKALKSAGLTPDDIGHINAHGLGVIETDRDEAAAINEVFGGCKNPVPVTSLKSYFGNSGASCGMLEIAGSLMGLQSGVVPPTLNYDTPDPECPINVISGEPLKTENRTFLNIDVTRQGQASAAVIQAN